MSVETYPTEPSAAIVDVRVNCRPILLTKPSVPRPTTVEVSSVGSIKLLMNVVNPVVVLCRVLWSERLEI